MDSSIGWQLSSGAGKPCTSGFPAGPVAAKSQGVRLESLTYEERSWTGIDVSRLRKTRKFVVCPRFIPDLSDLPICWPIPNDGGDARQSEENTDTIMKNCKDQIDKIK